jgi:lysophospholipase L1-like esterase
MARYASEVKVSSDGHAAHEHRPGAAARLMNVDIAINSDGLRDREYAVVPTDAYRMIFLGDSLTFGWGVEQEDTFESLLERRLNELGRVEILNFGVGNYNTAQQVALFTRKGLKYRPDKVVVFYFINDAEPTPRPSEWSYFAQSRLLTFYWSRLNAVLAKYSADRSFLAQYRNLYRPGQPGWIAAQASFRVLRDLCAANDIALQVVLLPELHELRNPPFRREYALVETFLRDEGIAVMNQTPAFSAVEENPLNLWVALDDAHPNEHAHRLIAQFSERFISPWSG